VVALPHDAFLLVEHRRGEDLASFYLAIVN
jgi:hypothetical protein